MDDHSNASEAELQEAERHVGMLPWTWHMFSDDDLVTEFEWLCAARQKSNHEGDRTEILHWLAEALRQEVNRRLEPNSELLEPETPVVPLNESVHAYLCAAVAFNRRAYTARTWRVSRMYDHLLERVIVAALSLERYRK